MARADDALGRLGVVRVFYPGLPDAWPGKAPGRSVVVSFKADANAVLSGATDASMTQWFTQAPRDLDVYWVYYHEPEDDIKKGKFTAAQYRDAFSHLNQLASQVGNPRLHSTLVLQSYTLKPASRRDWHDYFPGASVIDVFAWDVYNRPGDGVSYSTPADLLDGPRQVSESVGKAFAVAELGSVLAPGDDGTGRAAWLRGVGEYVKVHKTVFVAYFNLAFNSGADDYRLSDEASRRAWQETSGS